MSVVTNLILSFSTSENEIIRIEEINTFSNNGRGFKLVSADYERQFADEPYGVQTWYGGSKYLETPLFIGAYNHLDINGLINHLKTIHWEEPENVQLILKTQDSDSFEIMKIQ